MKTMISIRFVNNSLLYLPFTTLISIIFIFYGNIILNYFNLEDRYPKIAKIIQLRRQFQRYYMILSILMIIFVCIIEIIFSLTILSF